VNVRRLTKIPFLLILAVASLLSLAGQALAYTGFSGLKSVWSGLTGWNTLWNGVVGTVTLDYGGTIPGSTAVAATLMPIIFGAAVLIMLLMGITLAITHKFQSVLIVAIAGIIGILGIILLQDVIMHLFSP